MRIFDCLLIVVCCGLLSGCVADRLNFWSNSQDVKKYEVVGLSDGDPIKSYVTSVIGYGVAGMPKDTDGINFAQESLRLDVLKALRSKGYYDARVTFADGYVGTYNVISGDVTRIKSVEIIPDSYANMLSDLSVSDGDPLDSSVVLAAQSKLYNALQVDNCAFALSVAHKVILDPKTRTAELKFYVEQGRKASFGTVSFTGSQGVDQTYLRHMIPWTEGDCFRNDLIASLRDAVMDTGLFEGVDVKLPEKAEEINVIPVEFVLKEKLQRSVRAGVSYYTNEGPGAVIGWEHRNFLGAGETFNADLTLSLREQSLKSKLSKPHFLRKNQSLVFKSSLNREDTDAYENLEIETGVGIKRAVRKYLSAHVGGGLKITRINEDNVDTKNYALFSPYTSLLYDSRDNMLDPHSGLVLSTSLSPFIDVLGQSDPFVRAKVGLQSYYNLSDKAVVAGRLNVGSILGSDTDNIPATERFYAGGGGSVRGFGYQEVGPFEDGDPSGGRSLIEGTVEARFKMSNTLGAVFFVDAGQVSDKVIPNFDNMSIGAGAGLRYYTDFGPIRFDVGVPINGKDNNSQNYQIYISIGQAF